MKPLIARRPVFDSREKIFAYDLALQGLLGSSDFYEEAQPEKLIAQLFLEIGIDRVAEGHQVLVTVDRDMVLSGSLPMLPADRVILQVPASVGVDDDSVEACRSLVASGYRLAIHVNDPHESSALLPLAHVIKFDVTTVGPTALATVGKMLRGYAAQKLATNVRHSAERDVCSEHGFELFEGFRFFAPETPSRRDIAIEHLNAFRVLKLVRDPAALDHDIEEILRGDVALSYKLLRMVNSAATGSRGVTSIGHALRVLGRDQVGRWLALLLVTDAGGEGVRGELVHLALVRARMCELLADVVGNSQARGPLFLVGMVSVLDQLLEVPMEALCAAMQLAPDLCGALLERSGFLGAALHLIESYVAGTWPAVELAAKALNVDPTTLVPSYLDALSWATQHARSNGSPP